MRYFDIMKLKNSKEGIGRSILNKWLFEKLSFGTNFSVVFTKSGSVRICKFFGQYAEFSEIFYQSNQNIVSILKVIYFQTFGKKQNNIIFLLQNSKSKLFQELTKYQ
eukprot:TRINITY_DN18054_c0_g2_i2.p6 TRINITY_DN18054_c0_g2~~TRINITY_DN18054_c0_g2_i2.p6  ORF type:complete len:107 (+),score=6.98 TRINITY_DN18054_c0_g2_i2:339-659(+)